MWKSNEIQPFLTPSVPLIALPKGNMETRNIRCPVHAKFVCRERFSMRSQEPVSCISSRFNEKDFVSEHPLHTTSQPQSVGLAFFLSGRIAALDMLRKCNFVRRGPERRKGTAHMIRKELEKEKASRKDVHLALCVEKLSSAKNSKPLSVRVARCR